MSIYEHHIFICMNERESSDSRGSCSAKGSQEVVEAFRKELTARSLKGKVRANKAGCLDQCSQGVTVVIYPQGFWYGRVTPQDVPEIFDAMLANRVVDRLRIDKKREDP